MRTEHEFFGEVFDHLADIREIVATGSSTALSDFRHYVEKHRPVVALQIVGWESVDHPTEGQLVAFAVGVIALRNGYQSGALLALDRQEIFSGGAARWDYPKRSTAP